MLSTGNPTMDAQLAFERATRARRRSALWRRLRGDRSHAALPVFETPRTVANPLARVREIPLDAIGGTLEPSRARMFDEGFRPRRSARARWERLWLADSRGVPIPPISVVCVGNGYAVRDGHHRVSVARARGAATIDAIEG